MFDSRRVYDRNAAYYDLFEFVAESLFFARWRRRFMRTVRGAWRIDAGVGTGKNAPYYGERGRVVGVDFSGPMLRRARRRYRGLAEDGMLSQADIEHLPFKDGSFDAGMASFVFCSVPDPVRGLRELLRVVKPGGRLYLMEHVRPEFGPLGSLFDMLNPVAVRLSGANINRRTTRNVRRAGWRIEREKRFVAGVFSEIVACRP
jgi:ubiquinone/menaquinone biosynthesis C-methylase UbiE